MYELWIDEELRKAVRRALGYSKSGTIAQRRFKHCPELRNAVLNPAKPPSEEKAAPAISAPSEMDKPLRELPTPQRKSAAEHAGADADVAMSGKRAQGASVSGKSMGKTEAAAAEANVPSTPAEKKRRVSGAASHREAQEPPAKPDHAATAAAVAQDPPRQPGSRSSSSSGPRGLAAGIVSASSLEVRRTGQVFRIDVRSRQVLQELAQGPGNACFTQWIESALVRLAKVMQVSNGPSGSAEQQLPATRGPEWIPAALPRALELLASRGVCSAEEFLSVTVPAAAELCLAAPRLIAGGLRCSQKNSKRCTWQFLRQEILCLHVLALFGLPGPQAQCGELDYAYYLKQEPDMLACFLTYIHHMLSGPASHFLERVEFILHTPKDKVLGEWAHWRGLQTPLKNFKLHSEHERLEFANGCMQAMFVGDAPGVHCGMLPATVPEKGHSQEALRYCLSPETMILPLVVPRLATNDAVVIVGAQQFNVCECRGSTVVFVAPFKDPSPVAQRRRNMHLVAFDALSFKSRSEQYEPNVIMRELLKAYAAFHGDPLEDRTSMRAVATGNWGGGGAKGDPELKAVLQWAAASEAGRDLDYFPQGLEAEEVKALHKFVKAVQAKDPASMGVGKLLRATVAAVGGMKRMGPKSVLARVLEKLNE
eukprot:gnl/TRDRNA2_/TRDRNA2_133407_c1_seq1.p1 gnl/TRDRNA2_/TRDRNA2_133407_c1~~gnl/TRDRNA2_/TRDRNA2_133407_c1_seq1.p1  ORF type:complete len:652 (-),score=152.60 gnl/TRDRNA2_/TRDRNA2_133407_c1_seq1:49-2004(-)